MAQDVYCTNCLHIIPNRKEESTLCRHLPNLASSIASPVSPPVRTFEYVLCYERNANNDCEFYVDKKKHDDALQKKGYEKVVKDIYKDKPKAKDKNKPK